MAREMAPISLRPSFSQAARGKLAELSVEIIREAGALERAVPSAVTREGIAELLSGMNSYYSNLIEGVKTLPEEVESALRDGFAQQTQERDRQQLALAHIRVEREMREKLAGEGNASLHSPDFLRWIHATFYRDLPKTMRQTETVGGNALPVEPGAFRDRGVTVGSHRPPEPGEVPGILGEFARYFEEADWVATDRLMVTAAAHHRLAWVHPFLDGNGRVARLYSHACLIQAKLDGAGLWSLSRGFARFRPRYYEALAAADRTEPFEDRRRLSEEGLGTFSIYFLETLLDQIQFMSHLLELPEMAARLERYVHFELTPKRHGEALVRLLKALYLEGEIVRGEVKVITGLRDTAAREVINLAFAQDLITSPTPKGKIRLAFPTKVLESYFPRLYLDLPL
ncbi:MAG: Fic family protein [Verrucomicrobiota bacterium]